MFPVPAQGSDVYAIGVGSGINIAPLKTIASGAGTNNVYNPDAFEDLDFDFITESASEYAPDLPFCTA